MTQDQIHAALLDLLLAETGGMFPEDLEFPEIGSVKLQILITYMVQQDHGIFTLESLQVLQRHIAFRAGKINPDIGLSSYKKALPPQLCPGRPAENIRTDGGSREYIG
jgi:hypothetical protein